MQHVLATVCVSDKAWLRSSMATGPLARAIGDDFQRSSSESSRTTPRAVFFFFIRSTSSRANTRPVFFTHCSRVKSKRPACFCFRAYLRYLLRIFEWCMASVVHISQWSRARIYGYGHKVCRPIPTIRGSIGRPVDRATVFRRLERSLRSIRTRVAKLLRSVPSPRSTLKSAVDGMSLLLISKFAFFHVQNLEQSNCELAEAAKECSDSPRVPPGYFHGKRITAPPWFRVLLRSRP